MRRREYSFPSARKRGTRMTPSHLPPPTYRLPSRLVSVSMPLPFHRPKRFCQLCASIPPFLRRYHRYRSYSDQLAPILFSFALDQLRSTAHVRVPEDTRYARGTKRRPIRAAIRASKRHSWTTVISFVASMTNISDVSTPKNQSIESRANDIGLSSDIEDVIEKIECLRLVWDHRGYKQCFSIDEIGRRKDFRRIAEYSVVSSCQIVPNDTINDSHYPQTRKQEREREHEQGQEQEQDILIERGPIKSQFCSPTRNQPYWSTAEQPRQFEANETFMIDYEKTVEQILRDKEYGEKLNACLDQLEDLEKASWGYYSGVKVANACPVKSLTRDLPLASAIPEDYSSDDTLLLENVLCGTFQEAQRVTRDSYLPSPEEAGGPEGPEGQKSCFDPLLGEPNAGGRASEAEARESPVAVDRTKSPRPSRQTFGYSPVDSPRISAASMYRPAQILPYSSSSSSSSSNQSYADTPSPNSSCRAILAPRIEPRFGEERENFLPWEQDGELARNNIDDDDLWSRVVEELVNGIEEEGPKEETCADPNEFHRSDARNWIVEQYGTLRLNEPNARDARDARDVTEEDEIAGSLLPWSIAPYAPQRSIFSSEARSIGATNSGGADPGANAVPFPRYARDSDDFSSLVRSLGNDSPSANDLPTSSPDVDNSKAERSITRTRDDFEIPKMVASFESRPRRRCNSDRSIMPWPSLNLPSVLASERLKERLKPKQVEKAMIDLLKRPVEELAKQDKDGDTMLMCLVGNPDELVEKMAYLVPLVERLSAVTGALTVTNDRGEDALYLAALNSPQFPYVAGYLAATMVEKGIDVSQRLYHTRGDTLIHSIAARGDTHAETLAELLALTTIQRNAVFDLSKRNYDGRTALHVAIESHEPSAGGSVSVETVKLLLKYGADPRMMETKCGDTALHMAVSSKCEAALVKVLLDASSFVLVNTANYNHDTPLHTVAAATNSVPLERLREVCWLLVHAGGQTNLLNRQGKTPLALVSTERRDVVRKIFYRRSR